jgi:GNAT superfamily N-acetyltransferase
MTVDELASSGFSVSTDDARIDRDFVHRFLTGEAPWALDIPRHVVDRAIDHSLCVGAYLHQAQVGFARAITDQATFAYVDDLFVISEHRGMGLGRWLVATLLAQDEVREVKSWWLLSDDQAARRLFSSFGFAAPEPERLARWMAIPGRSREFWGELRNDV